MKEPVAPEDDPLRVHQRSAGRGVLEEVVLEEIVVGKHVVEAETQVAGDIAADDAVRGRLDVEPVAHPRDLVFGERETVGVPDVDSAALLARVLARDPFDPASLDPGAARLAQVDAEERPGDPAVPDRNPTRRHMNTGRVSPEIAASPSIDVETLDDDPVGADADDAARARAHEPRPAPSDQTKRPVDHQITGVDAGPDFHDSTRRRGVHARLKRRGLRRRGAAFQAGGRGRRHLLAGDRRKQDQSRKNHPATRESATSLLRDSRHVRNAAPAMTRTAAASA